MKFTRVLTGLGLAVLLNHQAHAVEGAVYGGPIGGTDLRNAYIPPRTGLYVGIADVPGVIGQYNGNNGGQSTTIRSVNFVSNTTAIGLEYVYPFQLFSGYLATTAQIGYLDYSRFAADNAIDQRSSGWGDLYSDILKWSRYLGTPAAPGPGRRPLPYGLTVMAAYSMTFPTGSYQPENAVTPGHNDYFISPNVAATYLTKPNFLGDGVELDAHLFYDHALENPYDHYRDGDIMNLDFAVGERAGRWTYGVAGFAAAELGHDLINQQPVAPRGDYFDAVKAGPIVSYDVPQLGMSFKGKLLLPVYTKNTLFGTTAVVVAAFTIL